MNCWFRVFRSNEAYVDVSDQNMQRLSSYHTRHDADYNIHVSFIVVTSLFSISGPRIVS